MLQRACFCPAAVVGGCYAAELGHNCEYAEKYFWQFVSQRSPWLTEAQTALRDYDSVSSTSTTTTSTSAAASLQGSGEGAEAQPGSAAARVVVPFRITDRYLQALVRYLLLAESGCEAAAENAAWMLLHGQGASGPRAMGLAAHLLYRWACGRLLPGCLSICQIWAACSDAFVQAQSPLHACTCSSQRKPDI